MSLGMGGRKKKRETFSVCCFLVTIGLKGGGVMRNPLEGSGQTQEGSGAQERGRDQR